MSELQVFNNAEFGSVRSLMVNGEPFFVGRDVAKILGYANPNDALAKRVDEEDKGVQRNLINDQFRRMFTRPASRVYSFISLFHEIICSYSEQSANSDFDNISTDRNVVEMYLND